MASSRPSLGSMTATPSHPFAESPGLLAVAARLGVKPAEIALRPLARGVTHDTLIIEVEGDPVAVLRLAPPRPDILPRHMPAQEGELLAMLSGSDLPVPEPLVVDHDGATLGRPGLMMSYVRGQNTLTWEQLRARCGEQTGEHALRTMVAMHALPLPVGWPSALDPKPHSQRDLEGARRLALQAGLAAPAALIAALDRLEADQPLPAGPACISHGDYRPANLMAAEGRITGILDWEMASTGDPVCDLGVATMREWGTWWPDEELLARYGQARGIGVQMRSLLWWRALGYCKVVAFLACRLSEEWSGPSLEPWTAGLLPALDEWGN